MKKGTRVEFKTGKGEIGYGVVEKGGDNKITVVLDGGEMIVKGYVRCFKESNHPLPKDKPNVMDKYSIKAWHEIKGHGDSRTFNATICKNGKAVIIVMNDGWGGCNNYNSTVINNRAVLDEFLEDCHEWVTVLGYPDLIEPEDTWVEWWQFRRPYGVTAQMEIDEYKKILKKS